MKKKDKFDLIFAIFVILAITGGIAVGSLYKMNKRDNQAKMQRLTERVR